MSIDNDEKCQCGRFKDEIHCPYCGRASFYGKASIKVTRLHPMTAIMTNDILMFHCKRCNKDFDDLQWQFECKAKPSKRSEVEAQRGISKNMLFERAKSGVRFDENERRHFAKICGMTYDEFMLLYRNQQQYLQKQASAVITGKALTSETERSTPYQYHVLNCKYCMTNIDECEVAKQLKIAEKMEQP